MPSSYKSVDLFGSGPHHFNEGPAGQQLIPRLGLGQSLPGLASLGDQQLLVTVRGRLVADDDGDLWTLIDAMKTQLAAWQTPGLLVDLAGHEWTGIHFARFEPAERIDHGRKASLAYTARFLKLEE